ncbi:transcriptional regulator, partial [Mesorhizobium sp. M2A.F.Ca.ET.040.01.1.1]
MPTIFDELLERFHSYLAGVDHDLLADEVARIGWNMPVRPLEPR